MIVSRQVLYNNKKLGFVNSQRRELLSLQRKESIGLLVVAEAFENYHRPAIVWSGGKDSTVVLGLVRDYVTKNDVKMPPALFIDHGQHFPETMDFLKSVSKAWDFNVIYAKNEDFINKASNGGVMLEHLSANNQSEAKKIGFEGKEIKYTLETDIGNHLLKTVPMKEAISKYRFDALLVGVRWDENPARSSEVFVSERSDPRHFRLHPILTFSERNIWEYTFNHKLPIHPLYYKGYRSIDGKDDTHKLSDVPAWEQDLENTTERAGRAQDKEGMMERLRSLGYM